MSDQSRVCDDSWAIYCLPHHYIPTLKVIYPNREAYESMIHLIDHLKILDFDGVRIHYEKFGEDVENVRINIEYFLATPEGHIFKEVEKFTRDGVVIDVDEVLDELISTYHHLNKPLPYAREPFYVNQ